MIDITSSISASDKCKITKDGLLFETITDLKDLIEEILIEYIQKDTIRQLNEDS